MWGKREKFFFFNRTPRRQCDRCRREILKTHVHWRLRSDRKRKKFVIALYGLTVRRNRAENKTKNKNVFFLRVRRCDYTNEPARHSLSPAIFISSKRRKWLSVWMKTTLRGTVTFTTRRPLLCSRDCALSYARARLLTPALFYERHATTC